MTQGERVKAIRKSSRINLTLEKFGEKIGIKKSSLSLIENGKNSLTEQTAKSICREFNVNYMWLTTGEGEMFVDIDNNALAAIDYIMTGEDEFRKSVIKRFATADDSFWEALERVIDECATLRKDDQR